MFEEINGVVLNGAVVEGTNGDDGQLRASFLRKFGAECLQTLFRALWDNAGEIGDVAAGNNFLDIVGGGGAHTEKQKEKKKEARGAGECRGGEQKDPLIHCKRLRGATETSIAIFRKKCKRSSRRMNDRIRLAFVGKIEKERAAG